MVEDKETKASEIALCVERLSQPAFRDEVERAVAGKDEDLLTRVCQKAGIPATYIAALIFIFLNKPKFGFYLQGWPPGP